MAHSCPDCGQTCYCNGDIDDCLFDFEEDANACIHWKECERDDDDEFYHGDSKEAEG